MGWSVPFSLGEFLVEGLLLGRFKSYVISQSVNRQPRPHDDLRAPLPRRIVLFGARIRPLK